MKQKAFEIIFGLILGAIGVAIMFGFIYVFGHVVIALGELHYGNV